MNTVIITGIVIIINAVINVVDCRYVSFCRFGAGSLAA